MKITQIKAQQGPSLSSKSSSKNFSRKKSSLFLLASLAASLISSQVFAENNLKFYGGVEAISQTTNFELRDNKSFIGNAYAVYGDREKTASRVVPGIFIGLDNGSNSRFELGFNQTKYSLHEQPYGYRSNNSSNEDLRKSYKFESSSLNLDYKPYLDLGKGFQIEGLLGVTYQKVKMDSYSLYTQGSNKTISSSSKTTNIISPSIGFGGRYEITKDLFLRTQLRYTYIDKTILSTKLRSTTGISLGVGYNF